LIRISVRSPLVAISARIVVVIVGISAAFALLVFLVAIEPTLHAVIDVFRHSEDQERQNSVDDNQSNPCHFCFRLSTHTRTQTKLRRLLTSAGTRLQCKSHSQDDFATHSSPDLRHAEDPRNSTTTHSSSLTTNMTNGNNVNSNSSSTLQIAMGSLVNVTPPVAFEITSFANRLRDLRIRTTEVWNSATTLPTTKEIYLKAPPISSISLSRGVRKTRICK
jgi:hypothetical protein